MHDCLEIEKFRDSLSIKNHRVSPVIQGSVALMQQCGTTMYNFSIYYCRGGGGRSVFHPTAKFIPSAGRGH